MFVPVRRYFLFSEPADYFFFSGYVPTGRLVSVKKFSENIMNFAHRRILIHIYFLYYYSAFLVYFFIIENRIEIKVGNQLKKMGNPVYFFCFVFRAGFNQNQSRRRESFPRRQNKP